MSPRGITRTQWVKYHFKVTLVKYGKTYHGYGSKYLSPFITIQTVSGMYFYSDPDTHINNIAIYHNLHNIYTYAM